MSDGTQGMRNVLSLFHDMAQKGPVLVSDVFDQELGLRVTLIEFEVSNKSRVPENLPFGIVAEVVNERNINKARLRARVLPGFFEWFQDTDPEKGPYVAPVSEEVVAKYDERICGLRVTKQVVGSEFEIPSGLDKMVWRAILRPLSGNAQLYQVETVVSVNTENVRFRWDDQLFQDVKEVRTLMPRVDADFNSVGAVGVGSAPVSQFKVTTFETVKCGWVDRVETFVNVTATTNKVNEYNTTVNYSLPPVLGSLPVLAWETKNGAMRYHPQMIWTKEEYRGPVAALVEVFWKPSPWTITPPAALVTTEIQYSCPFFSINTGPCLHPTILVAANTGTNDPEWAENALSERSFPATPNTTWPSTMVIDDEAKPYMHGFIRQRVTITTP
jgi:hypothetical protein